MPEQAAAAATSVLDRLSKNVQHPPPGFDSRTIITELEVPHPHTTPLAVVPIAVLVLVFRKSVVSGLTSGAVKG